MNARVTAAREVRLAEVVGAAVRQYLADSEAERVALLDDGAPEVDLLARWLGAQLGEAVVVRVTCSPEEGELLLHPRRADRAAGEEPLADVDRERLAQELRRLRARLVEHAVVASAQNKTALLLGGPLPPEPLLPLGDLYASDVRALTGDWSAPAAVFGLAEAAGGVGRLDEALRERIERRNADGLHLLEPGVRERVEDALARGQASRLHPRLVPKLGTRTLGVDLFE